MKHYAWLVLAMAAATSSSYSFGAAAEYNGDITQLGEQKESRSSFHCSEALGGPLKNGVMVWRTHEGDENGDTVVGCASFKQGGTELQFESAAATEHKIDKESDHPDGGFTCPGNKVLVGREHDGDENGETRYFCRALLDHWGKEVVPEARTSIIKKESEFDLKCAANEVMTGRYHRGDENALSLVECAKLF